MFLKSVHPTHRDVLSISLDCTGVANSREIRWCEFGGVQEGV